MPTTTMNLNFFTYRNREVLQLLYKQEMLGVSMYANKVARKLNMTSELGYKIVSDLARRGFIHVEDIGSRFKYITLTQKGKDIAEQFANIDTILNEE